MLRVETSDAIRTATNTNSFLESLASIPTHPPTIESFLGTSQLAAELQKWFLRGFCNSLLLKYVCWIFFRLSHFTNSRATGSYWTSRISCLRINIWIKWSVIADCSVVLQIRERKRKTEWQVWVKQEKDNSSTWFIDKIFKPFGMRFVSKTGELFIETLFVFRFECRSDKTLDLLWSSISLYKTTRKQSVPVTTYNCLPQKWEAERVVYICHFESKCFVLHEILTSSGKSQEMPKTVNRLRLSKAPIVES